MERGKKTNKDRLFEQVEKRARGEAQGVDASHLAQSLGIPRNLASSLLNELAAEGKIRKKKTRPVLFYCDCREEDQEEEDPFREFIGFDKSLREQMEKCRLAANYPNRGMPVMILGPSGVGKSLMAEYIFRYAKFKKLIPEDALFVVLNCADYANNQELLSSILFGYKKGAFTGAAETTEDIYFWMSFTGSRRKDRKSCSGISTREWWQKSVTAAVNPGSMSALSLRRQRISVRCWILLSGEFRS